MKRITAYVSPSKVRFIIGELSSGDVKEIKVVAYFKPLSEASRIDLLCEEGAASRIQLVIQKLGTTDSLPDHMIFVNDFTPKPIDRQSNCKRMGQLDE